VKNVMWDGRIYLSMGDFDAGLIATVTTRLFPRRNYLSIQPQPRLWHNAFPRLHVPRKISPMNPNVSHS
jgi:hypothetical protein